MSTAPTSPENSAPPAAETATPATPAGGGDEAKRGPIKVGRTSGAPSGQPGGGQQGGGQRRDRGPRPPKPQRPRREGEPQSANEREDSEEAALDAAAEQQRQAGRRGPVPVPNRRGPLSAELEAELKEALGDLSIEDVVSGKTSPAPSAGRVENETQVRAAVIEVHGDNIFVSLGGKNQGVVSVRNFETPPAVGDILEVTVTGFNAEDDLHEVNVAGGKVVGGDWTNLIEGSIVEAKVTAANTGGLECTVGGARAFIPASQVSLFRTENLADYVDQKLVCVVTEANERRGNLVLSRRGILEREKEESKKKLLGELEAGQLREGIVRKIQDFGAFVDLGGVDGLIHISQMSWERIKHPSEILKEGQKIRVRVDKIDLESGKIGLSLKNPEEHPWTGIEQRFPVGTIIRGPVTRLASFGCFVKIAPGVEGMVHISELAHNRVYAVQNVVKEGQEVEAKILAVDADAQRIALSMKATIQPPQKENTKKEEAAPVVEEPVRAPIVPKREGELKGGTKRKAGGEKFGLNW
ncbi:30S ribosomal protein S1 [Anatilimnocola aggregata]|uniref:30S ribosomal protein S1 n=1 Tax=Anatilimnocola aggregata TaxID=2528021 RepID=A0A517YDE6_9BACT|nr:S1 RNA-binding domain-containing protein [Anatilimnocola aggregata]QDU28263.1 30S ribosomal protein S1 [Anatilimnocola aggregata]